jgi:L-glyceraldehyde 3-phosphate reductase
LPARLIADAVEVALELGAPTPCAAQLPYSLVQRSPVEDEDMVEVLRGSGIPVIASAVLAGGALTGKYTPNKDASKETKGRVANRLEEPRVRRALGPGERLRALAERIGAKPAALAIAYTLSNPDVASVLFGATSPAQVLDNVTAPALLASMDDEQLAELRRIGL